MLDSAKMATDEHTGTIAVASTQSGVAPAPSRWSNRILTLAVAGILVLTLYPFRFDFSRHLSRPLFPLSLGGWGKQMGPLDDILNVLLFMPYGFGLADKLRERSRSRFAVLGFTLAAGAALSYTVEFLQIYLPYRDSGWEDIFTNSLGAVAGAWLFDLCGKAVVGLLSETERKIGAWLTWQRALAILLIYIGLWSAAAVCLEQQTRLSNWSVDSVLVIGNSASKRFSSAWKGRVFALEIWNHAISADMARRVTLEKPTESDPNALVAYRFSGPGPFRDDRRLLPDLSWTPQVSVPADPSGAFLDGTSWLISPGAVPALVNDLRKAGHFSLWVACEPAETAGVNARIVSISSPTGQVNMDLRQQDANLVFWFRMPLSIERERMDRMSWIIPKVFAEKQRRDILFTFDSTNLNLFVDGKQDGRGYEVGAGAALARFVRRVKMRELKGYKYVFYALVFIPVGCLLGFVWRTTTRPRIGLLLLALGLALPTVVFEIALVHVSGRAVSFGNIWLSILLGASGSIWINADRVLLSAPAASPHTG